MKTLIKALTKRLLLTISFVALVSTVATTSLNAQDVQVSAKFKEKIEKVVVGQILESIKKSDYDIYRLLKTFWTAMKNQSVNGVLDSLKELLIEKGLILLIYFPTKQYVYNEYVNEYFLKKDYFQNIQGVKELFNYELSLSKFFDALDDVYTDLSIYIYQIYDNIYYLFQEPEKYFDEATIQEINAKKDAINGEIEAIYEKIYVKEDEYYSLEYEKGDIQYAVEVGEWSQEDASARIIEIDAKMETITKEMDLLYFDTYRKEAEGSMVALDFITKQRQLNPAVAEDLIKNTNLEEAIQLMSEDDVKQVHARLQVAIKLYRQIILQKNELYKLDYDIFDKYQLTTKQQYEDALKKYTLKLSDLEAIYSEVVAFKIRVAMSKSTDSIDLRDVGNFTRFAYVLNKLDPKFPKDSYTLNLLKSNIKVRLDETENTDLVLYNFYVYQKFFVNQLISNAADIVTNYRSSNSFYDLMTPSSIKAYFLARDTKEKVLENVTPLLQLAAITADYIQNGDPEQVANNFKRFIAQFLIKKLKQFDKQEVTITDDDLEKKYGKALDDFVIHTISYIFGDLTDSQYVGKLKDIAEYIVGFPLTEQGFKDKLKSVLNVLIKKAFYKDIEIPFTRSIFIKAIEVYIDGTDPSEVTKYIKANVAHLVDEVLLIAELIPKAREILNYTIPLAGTKIKTLIKLVILQDSLELKQIVSQVFRETVIREVRKLPEDVRDIIEPFVELSINYAILGIQPDLKEVTAIAFEIINKLDNKFRTLYVGVGFSFGAFYDTNDISAVFNKMFTGAGSFYTTSRLYLSDKIGIDFIGLGYDLAQATKFSPWRTGIFVGGILDYALTEGLKIETGNQPADKSYIKFGAFFGYEDLVNPLFRFDLSFGFAMTFKWEPSWFLGFSWNVLELSDLL